MTPGRWKRMEELYYSALRRPEGERPRYLREACPDDEALVRELENLLRTHKGRDDFLDESEFRDLIVDFAGTRTEAARPSRLLVDRNAGSGSSLSTIPFLLLETAATRLAWVALACAITTVAMVIIQYLVQPEVRTIQKQLHIQINTALVIVVSLGLFAARRFGWVSAEGTLHLGLVFEAVVGYALAAFEYSLPWGPQEPVRGVSWMVLWIALGGLLIPHRPLWMTAATVVTASMGPVAYLVFHPQPIPINRLLIWSVPNYLVGIATVLISLRLYHLEIQVERAKEMGSYKLDTIIGKGGMGEVWRARHRLLARDSAIKLIRPEILLRTSEKNAAKACRRFEQEAKTTALLRSPHTVALYDFGTSRDGGFYYVMELLDGIDLENLVKRYGPLPASRTIHILRQACKSLAEAHRVGVVHRDIKPTNIFLCRCMGTDYDFVKVLDFGLVKTILGEAEPGVTADVGPAGTPAYMPPEIALSREGIDGRADVYGLGCVAYWLLTGRLVFEEKTSMATINAHIQSTPVAPSERAGIPIPASLDRVTLACLAKSPAERPPTAEALSQMLAECGDAGCWTQENAEIWWTNYLPETTPSEPPVMARRATAPTSAIPTL